MTLTRERERDEDEETFSVDIDFMEDIGFTEENVSLVFFFHCWIIHIPVTHLLCYHRIFLQLTRQRSSSQEEEDRRDEAADGGGGVTCHGVRGGRRQIVQNPYFGLFFFLYKRTATSFH